MNVVVARTKGGLMCLGLAKLARDEGEIDYEKLFGKLGAVKEHQGIKGRW